LALAIRTADIVSIKGTSTSLILDPSNAGAIFMVASQFNALEMISPERTPSDSGDLCER